MSRSRKACAQAVLELPSLKGFVETARKFRKTGNSGGHSSPLKDNLEELERAGIAQIELRDYGFIIDNGRSEAKIDVNALLDAVGEFSLKKVGPIVRRVLVDAIDQATNEAANTCKPLSDCPLVLTDAMLQALAAEGIDSSHLVSNKLVDRKNRLDLVRLSSIDTGSPALALSM